jgi:hypothetical protein
MPVILATQEAQIRRIAVQSQPRQIVGETLSRKKNHKNWAGGVAQREGLEFKLQHCKKKEKEKKYIICICGDIIVTPSVQLVNANKKFTENILSTKSQYK